MGSTMSAMKDESWPPETTYSVQDVPDLTGKVVMVTGSNTGIGKLTVKALLNRNAKVYMACRSKEKTEQAIEELRKETGKEAYFLKLDLADLKSVKAAAEEYQTREKELHILFNNAGLMSAPVDQVTADGYDLQWGTNVLGPFYFTKLLLPTLIATAKSSPEKHVRVITTASVMHYLQALDFNTFKDGPARRKKRSLDLYCQSKFGNIVFAKELARRYGDQGIISIAANPGNLFSDLQRHLSWIEYFLLSLILYPTEMGPLTQLWGGTSEEAAKLNGEYLAPWARVGRPSPETQDPKLGKQVWEWLEEQVEKL